MSNYLRKIMMNCDYEKLTPLTFTAEAAGSTVKLTITGSPTVEGLQYRIGTSGGWSPYTIDTVITLANIGDCVQFQNTLETLGTSDSNYASFVITGQIAASGNCMSMLNYSDKVSPYAFHRLFNGCSSLTSAPELPATTLEYSCYDRMFYYCSSLTSAPELPATKLTNSCYLFMFNGCSSLVTAPILPATTLAISCYSHMFGECTSLISAPELPATTLANYCYNGIFQGCTSLVTAPILPAMTLAVGCYSSMFYGCTSLTSAPELPATTLANYCYYSMFNGCSSLVTAPILPATTLAISCYSHMFGECKSLINAPELPATVLVDYCYQYMFNRCTKLNYIKVNFSSWVDNTTNNWVAGVSSTGVFNAPSNLPNIFGDSNIPTGWTITNN